MFPAYLQRLILLLAILLGGVCYYVAGGYAMSADGASGCVLLRAEFPMLAIGAMAVATVIAGVLGGFASATGNGASGMFVVGGSMLFAGWRGGDISSWLRSIESSGAYQVLFFDALVWLVLVGLGLIVVFYFKMWFKKVLPSWLCTDSFEYYIEVGIEDLNRTDESHAGSGEVGQRRQLLEATGLALYGVNWRSWLTMLATGVVGALLSWMLMRDAGVKQVTWVLVVCFMTGGMLAARIFPTRKVGMVGLSPLFVACGVYVIMMAGNLTSDQLLRDWYGGRMFRLALVLPVFWASAGLVGVSIGIGWGQALIASQLQMAGVFDEYERMVEREAGGGNGGVVGGVGGVGGVGESEFQKVAGEVKFLNAETGGEEVVLPAELVRDVMEKAKVDLQESEELAKSEDDEESDEDLGSNSDI